MRTARTLATIALAALIAPVWAQSFPAKPITLICPWPPGGRPDVHLRKFAEIAQKYLGQPIIIENKPGGGGMIGPAQMARLARPDGYTLSQLPITAYRLPHQRAVDWEPLKDFSYVIGITGYTFGVVVRADSPFKGFRELIDYARANPAHLKPLALLDQVYWYKSSEDYARWAAETFAAERATIERVGLLAK